MSRGGRAVFLDRDGTINFDPGYINHPDKLELIPGAPEALAALKAEGFLLVVVSNQSGVGRGLIEPGMIPRINERLNELLTAGARVSVDHFELCFHRPDEGCECRKPKPKLLRDAALKLDVDLAGSFMVGDKTSDAGAGRAAGCQGVALVRTGEGAAHEGLLSPGDCDFVGEDLPAVSRWIISASRRARPADT